MVIGLISIDQIIKFTVINTIYNSSVTVIKGILDLTYIENTGGAFGIWNNNTKIFIIVNIVVIAIVVKFIISKKKEISTYVLISLGLILAGGIGNLIDRIVRGFVVDYIDFNPLIKYPVFNIADVCVVIGCGAIGIILVIDVIKGRKK